MASLCHNQWINYLLCTLQVIAVARTADLVLMMLDATKGDVQRVLLEKELESVGIRLNRKKPNIYFKVKPFGSFF